MAGRLAPFIELGVGFNPELTARENVVLNGVMMGLTPQETRDRLDAVIEFAELEEFVDLKLKNYSSGMLVRLAFSVMMQADADILLIDEVLAVGDAAFQQKCADVFHEMKAPGKTIVLVTHDMATVEAYCHRAMLIDDGADPAHRRPGRGRPPATCGSTSSGARAGAGGALPVATRARCGCSTPGSRTPSGERVTNVEHGEDDPPAGRDRSAARRRRGSAFGFMLANADGVGVFQFGAAIERRRRLAELAAAGERVTVSAEIENLLGAGPLLRPLRGQPRPPAAASPSTSTTRSTSSSSAASPGARDRRARRTRSTATVESGGDAMSVERRAPPSCARCAAPRRSAAAGGASSTCSG